MNLTHSLGGQLQRDLCANQSYSDKSLDKKCMSTLSGAPGGQVIFHSEKCCGFPYNLLVISGV